MNALHDVPAPAKLNLFLHITGRRDDGYHLLQSVFMLIDWADTLHFEKRTDGRIIRIDLGAPLPADDLVLRAARALQKATGTRLGVTISIDKQIPAEAGMGGGSSDAASCLLALNRLWDTRLSMAQLQVIGLSLGADVPFFLGGKNAWVEGIGEKLTPVALPPARFLVVKPDAGLETRAIFTANDLKRDSETATITGFAANPFDFGQNDLQPVAERLCSPVSQAIDWLESQGFKGRMTGSGSAVFAQMCHVTKTDDLPAGFRMRTCHNLAVHPLWGWATSDNSSVGD